MVGSCNTFQILWLVDAATEQTPIAEQLGTCQRSHTSLHAAHRQAGHCTMVAIGDCGEMLVDIGNKFIHQNALEGSPVEFLHVSPLQFVGHTVGHHYDEGSNLTLGNEVVHDQTCMTLTAPGSLILAPTMLQIKHGIPRGLLGLLAHLLAIERRCIDHGATYGLGALAPEQYLLDAAMRNVLQGIEVAVVGRNLDARLPANRSIVVAGTGIVERAAVDSKMIVMESFVHRGFGGADPYAILVLVEHGAATAAQA